MELIWNGVDITHSVNITGCVYRDVSCGRCDSLELTLDHASTWYRWGPQADDEIIVNDNGFSTGALYLNAVIPIGDQFRILATGVKRWAAHRAWDCYQGMTIQGIFERCAAECGMHGKLYGIDGGILYPYAMRKNEGCAAFLNRIGGYEGLAVKASGGAFRGIAIEWAQARSPALGIEIMSGQQGITYRRLESGKITRLTVQSPYASATARDAGADGNNPSILPGLPAMDGVTAGRWARGLLLMHNRRAEEITIEQTMDKRMAAMVRVDVAGDTDMTGAWIIDEAEHDLMNRRTTAKLLRVIDTIL